VTVTTYRYVRHHDVDRYTAIGWQEVDELRPCHHDFWSTILVWKGDGDPIEPEREKAE
jgi:hypothetical protein